MLKSQSFKAYYVGLERPGLTPLPEDLRLVAGNRFASEPNGLDPDASTFSPLTH